MRFIYVLLFLIGQSKCWGQAADQTHQLNFDLSKGFAALEHLQYERAHQVFKTLWQQTFSGQKVSQQYLSQHLFACEGLAWVYYGRMDANLDSVAYFTQVPYLKQIAPLHQFRLGYMRARALLPKFPTQALQAFQQLLQNQGTSPDQGAQLWYHIGVCHQNLNQWSLAKAAFKRCLQLVPAIETWVIGRGKLPFIAHLALMDIALKMKQAQVAEQALSKAQNSKPAGFQSSLELDMRHGELAIVKKQFSAALLHFKSAAQTLERWIEKEEFLEPDEVMLREDYAYIFDNAAWCALQMKNYPAAISWVERGKNKILNGRLISAGQLKKTSTFEMHDLSQLVKKLGPASTVLRYFQARDTMYALVLNRQQVHLMAVSDTSALAEHVFLLNQLDPQQIDYAEHYAYHASWIYQYFVEPLEKWITTRNLLIIPDGALNLLAFESLCTQPDPRQLPFLIEKYAIWYAPGLIFLRHAQAQRHLPSQRWLGIAPDFDQHPSRLPPLQYNQKELVQVQKLTGGKALLGARATKQRLMAQLPRAQHVHFSTHGVLSRNNSDNNQMVLAEQGKKWDSLDVEAVKQLSFEGKDITLSTCYSGLSRYILRNEEMNSLRRAFMQAGARTVLQSTWRLPDIASYLIISEYYAALKEGKNQALALQIAKLNYLHHSEELRRKYQVPADVALSPLPHHWQMIVGHGLPHQVQFTPVFAPGKWILGTSGFGLLFLFLFWLWLRKPKRKVDF